MKDSATYWFLRDNVMFKTATYLAPLPQSVIDKIQKMDKIIMKEALTKDNHNRVKYNLLVDNNFIKNEYYALPLSPLSIRAEISRLAYQKGIGMGGIELIRS